MAFPILAAKMRGRGIARLDQRFTPWILSRLGIPADSGRLPAGAYVRAAPSTRADPDPVREILAFGADLNLNLADRGPLPSVRSGVNSYIRFRTLIKRQAPPHIGYRAALERDVKPRDGR